MKDSRCIAFLQWAVPKLQVRWAGFGKIRLKVCKFVTRRLNGLGLACVSAYHADLETHPED